ncbi:hypothetical protein QIA05_00520 (plasmid) [Borreliella burgdorferi]|uniref:hypothetical protein n=1 Tax=Borreliella burgdorferi TaxID=139 RepID=UPI003AEFF4BC|nr:hypothetical protein QIA05_00520 [Borreliella burgdorferi]
MLKEKFKETLEKTVKEVYPEIQKIKEEYSVKKITEGLDTEILEKNEDAYKKYYIAYYINENYQIFDYSTYSVEFKQNQLNQ